jgi:hypothetical protein
VGCYLNRGFHTRTFSHPCLFFSFRTCGIPGWAARVARLLHAGAIGFKNNCFWNISNRGFPRPSFTKLRLLSRKGPTR